MRRVKRHPVTQPEDISIKLIPLTQGYTAMVDSEDYQELCRHNWCIVRSTSGIVYAFTNIKQPTGGHKGIKMHTLLTGVRGIDHKNGNSLDNRRANLRKATASQNARNVRKRKTSSSGVKGVSWYPRYQMWVARIMADGKRICLGYFRTKEDAAEAYRAAAPKYHGEFARVA